MSAKETLMSVNSVITAMTRMAPTIAAAQGVITSLRMDITAWTLTNVSLATSTSAPMDARTFPDLTSVRVVKDLFCRVSGIVWTWTSA